ncbi:MAG: TAXI family TRAP transporter solute-binding subunit [Spirochaetales bacterium]|nr:TAXI family TRAP transporter solute-binding subunit [Spirochaetales bacterium]
MNKKIVMFLVFTMLLTSICFAGGNQEKSEAISIATAGTAGALYPMGVALAQVISEKADGVTASAESSGASLENMRNLKQGNVEWGISQNEVAYQAIAGMGPYENNEFSDLRSLFGTLISWVQIFVPKDSEIESVADFAGKRIGVGQAGSGGEAAAKKVLAYSGLDYDSIRPEFISDSEMVNALKDGVIDGFISTHPLKSAALLDLTTTFKVKIIPIADAGFYTEYPYYTKLTIPPGTYKGVDYPVDTPTSRIVMYTTKALSEDVVYESMKAIWGNMDDWVKVHAAVEKYTSLEDACTNLSAPLHKGAAKYYKEMGVAIPAEYASID